MGIFKKEIVGLDISDNTIELVFANQKNGSVKIISKNSVNLPDGIVEKGVIKEEEKLATELKKLFANAKPKPIEPENIIFAIPENQVFLHFFTTDNKNDNELPKIVKKEAATNIPIAEDNLIFSHKVIDRTENGIEILITAVSKENYANWKKFFDNNNFEILLFDIETLASFRSLFDRAPTKPVCLIDMGSTSSRISIFDSRGLRYSYSTNIAGDYIDKEMAKSLELKIAEAEETRKNTKVGDKRSKASQILTQSIDDLSEKISQTFDFAESKGIKNISKIILIGGLSLSDGLNKYLSKKLNIEVISGKNSIIPKSQPINFVGAIGMAQRGLQKKWDKKDPGFSMDQNVAVKSKSKEKVSTAAVDEKDVVERESLLNISRENREKRKLKTQIITLVSILLIGSILIGFLFYNQQRNRDLRYTKIENSLVTFDQSQTFEIKIPIALTAEQFTSDRIKGRLIENETTSARDYDSAKISAFGRAKKQLNEGEIIWEEPINEIIDEEEFTLPLLYEWLVYPEDAVNKMYEKEALKLIGNQDSALSNIIKTGYETTDNENIIYLIADVTYSLEKQVDLPTNPIIEINDDEKLSTSTSDE